MVDDIKNPYRKDWEADAIFVGREALLSELCGAVRSGRSAIRAVMGGRGMGKSSLAKQIQIRLAADALTVVASGSLPQIISRVGAALGVDLAAVDPVAALAMAAKRHPKGRAAIVIDEIESVLDDPGGRGFLDNLKQACRDADDRLAVIVLGGTAVNELLIDKASPFARNAKLHTLYGLERDEAAELLRLPLDLEIPDPLVDALWVETAGHPWLLQMFMEYAVDDAPSLADVVGRIPAAMQKAELQYLCKTAFPIWWDNLRERGQLIYRRLVQEGASVPRARWAECFGTRAEAWLEVLASTGVAVLEHEAVIARGAAFQRWANENPTEMQAATMVHEDALGALLSAVRVDTFERLVVRALATWARGTVVHPVQALRKGAHTMAGNDGLHHEAHFQALALIGLLQHEHDFTAAAEALSMKPAGRSDITVWWRQDPMRRACVELKIFGRNDHEVVKQVLGYASPEDTFAAVVSVDRHGRPLRPAYEEKCFDGAPHEAKHDAAPVVYPAFYTVHAREGCGPLRVWHFLVQLRDA